MTSYFEKYKALKYQMKLRSLEGRGVKFSVVIKNNKQTQPSQSSYSFDVDVYDSETADDGKVATVTISSNSSTSIKWNFGLSKNYQTANEKTIITKAKDQIESRYGIKIPQGR